VATRLKYETRILALTLLSGAPAVIFATWLIGTADYSAGARWTLAGLLFALWWGVAHAVRERVVRPLQTAANLLSALREEDFSIRARSPRRDDVLGELMREINALSQTLREQRLGALEAGALLRTVMSEVDVAVFAFDEAQRLQLVNRAGERLLARPSEQLLGRTAAQLGLEDLLQGDPARTVQLSLPGSDGGRWGIRRSSFRQEGRPHPLLVMTDLSRALRDEERQAWQRIVRVIGHELNNSLAPIKSIAGTMGALLAKSPRPTDWESDLQGGLAIIASRADALSRFMEAYARLARLPPPQPKPMQVAGWIGRVAGLETRLKVEVEPGPDITLQADADQLEQLLINLVRNAADARLAAHADAKTGVKVGWSQQGETLEVYVEDEGPGISNPANLFVPFFTTKPGGSGIGLVLCRQIAEAHGGSLTLENRKLAKGSSARLRLPVPASKAG
jgi:nitrogen fixation/metabolism regulation signal transduction histidine kinase